ncbi:hypothetical protein BC827DRAFT_45831 [Russula dissimulans]|nr:hypothetical protein BC827DRAFT_45831 [Russula dissimulans]
MGPGPIPTVLPTIGNTIGALVVGWGLSSLIFGMLCIQVWTYYLRYPNDGTVYKVLVFTLWILEAVHQAFVGHVIWFYIVDNGGSLLAFINPPVWTLSIQTLLGAFVGLIVKICFGMRVWKFSKGNFLVTGFIIVMAFGQFGMCSVRPRKFCRLDVLSLNSSEATAVVYTMRSFQLRVGQADEIKALGTTALSLGVITDMSTAASLSFFLHKMRTGYKKSDTLINRLIIYSVNTGLVTSIFSAAVLTSYNLMPTNLIFIALYFILSKLYANSCLATLNTRRFVHGRGTDREDVTIPTFLMVAHTLPGPRSAYPQREVQFDDDLEEQKVSVAPESDKVVHFAV